MGISVGWGTSPASLPFQATCDFLPTLSSAAHYIVYVAYPICWRLSLPNMAEETVTSTVRKWYNVWNVKPDGPSRCDDEQLTQQLKGLFDSLGEGIKERYYGTGLVIPENVQGKRILDIGCGAGSLVFILSKLVGPTGYVIGIDVCDGAIQTAKDQSEYHWKQWGYDKPNFEFRVLNVEHVHETIFRGNDFDIIVSSGVFCMLPNKERAFRATYTLLKPGGLFYMNDVMAEQDTPEKCRDNEILCAEGIAGAMRSDSLAVMAQAAGFTAPHLTSVAPIEFVSQEYRNMLELGRYVCAGWRLFKLDPSRAKGANKGPALVTYNGGITDYPDAFPWDVDLTFKKGEGVKVDEQLATLLSSIYLSDCFSFKPASGHPVTSRAQNPFRLMDKLEAEGKLPPPIFQV